MSELKYVDSYYRGKVSITVWEKSYNDNQGNQKTFFLYTPQLSYKDQNGEWKNSTFFSASDLVVISELISMIRIAGIKLRSNNKKQTQSSPGPDSVYEKDGPDNINDFKKDENSSGFIDPGNFYQNDNDEIPY